MKTKFSLSTIMGIALLIIFSAPAQAQMSKQRKGKEIKIPNMSKTAPTPTRYSLDVGVVAPEKNQKTLGSQGLLWGIGYGLPEGDASSTGKLSLDLVQAKLSKQGSRLETTGLFYTERLPVNGTSAGASVGDGAYYGLGLGFVRTKIRFNPATPAGNTQFAVRGILGLAVSDRLRLESSYIWAKKVRNYSVSQFTLSLGVQF
jgi:hypothetical protein